MAGFSARSRTGVENALARHRVHQPCGQLCRAVLHADLALLKSRELTDVERTLQYHAILAGSAGLCGDIAHSEGFQILVSGGAPLIHSEGHGRSVAGTRGNLLHVLTVFPTERFIKPLRKGVFCRR